MQHDKRVPIAESALLVIDVQDSFKLGERWSRRSNMEFEGNITRLIDAYRRNNLPVIYFLHSDGDPGFKRDDPEYRLMDFVKPLGSEPLIHKETRNVFTSTHLAAMLMSKGVRRVAIAGIQMEQCCETSARVAADLGFAVDFITEATLTFPIPGISEGQELSVAAIRERTEYVLRDRFATIASVDSLVNEMEVERSSTIRAEA